jgi:hypothetical protein
VTPKPVADDQLVVLADLDVHPIHEVLTTIGQYRPTVDTVVS